MTIPGAASMKIAYPAGAWLAWGAWMLGGVALGLALLLGLAAVLVVMLPWAIRTALKPTGPHIHIQRYR